MDYGAGGRSAAAARGSPYFAVCLLPSVPYPHFPSIWQEDAVLLRHALRHGTRQWGRLVRGKQLLRGNKACCNRFLFLKKKFTQKPTDATLPAQQQFQQGPSVSTSSSQPQRHMCSRPDVALQYGGLSLVECMQLFLPAGIRDIVVPPAVSPDHAPEFNPAPAEAILADPEQFVPSMGRLGRENAVAAAAVTAAAAAIAAAAPAAAAASGQVGEGATGAQQRTASVADRQLAHILFPELRATDVCTMNPMNRGMKRLRNVNTGFSSGGAHTGTCEGLSAVQLQNIEVGDALAERSLLLQAADSRTCQRNCGNSPLSSASHWHSTSRKPFAFSLTQSSLLHTALPNIFSPSLHSTVPPPTTPSTALPIAPARHNPLPSPSSFIPFPSAPSQFAALFTPTPLITPTTLTVSSAPTTVINRGPPHSIPSFPLLSDLQSALHSPPAKAPLTLSDPQHYPSQCYPSRSASPSNAASSASVECSPPSSQTSSQPSFQHVFRPSATPVESQQLRATAAPSAAPSHPAAAATSASVLCIPPIPPVLPAAAALPTSLYHATMDTPPLSSPALAAEHGRPQKMPRTSRGVLPPAALEFARSFFSGLLGRVDHQGSESSDREGLPSLSESLLSDMVTAATAAPGVTATPDVTDSPAAAALAAAAAAEGIPVCQGEVSIWKDLIELEGGEMEVVCGVEKRAGLALGSFCELEVLLQENEQASVAPFGTQ
ncbi:unnamed protein product [Closterium sp. NIES-64]|nr:unnamed protein product [Closterium sp. NIES-64]CAI6000716.1 unnamed protein product [Closterium sp. NIES-64]